MVKFCMDYLKDNRVYWNKRYDAPNVESYMFRLWGRILRDYFPDPARVGAKLLDFGCGQGAAVNFFRKIGFDAHGVDISEIDIEVAKTRYSHVSHGFSLSEINPRNNEKYGPYAQYDVITGFQSFYYFSQQDFFVLMETLERQLKPGGIFYATMMGKESLEYYGNSVQTEDPWLRRVDFNNSRLNVSGYHIFFVDGPEDIEKKFSMFEKLHIGFYSDKIKSDEPEQVHFTFCGRKKSN